MAEETLSGTILTNALGEMLTALGLTLSDVGKFVRLDEQLIQKLRDAATCLPAKLVDKVFCTNEVSLSGDWVAGITKDANNVPWLVLLLERGSRYNECKYGAHFAQTTFALSSVGIGDIIYQNLHADYGGSASDEHLRYTDLSCYNKERNMIVPNVSYDKIVGLQDPGLSSIIEIWYRGIDNAMQKI